VTVTVNGADSGAGVADSVEALDEGLASGSESPVQAVVASSSAAATSATAGLLQRGLTRLVSFSIGR
jgi:hypothetical protein